MKCKVCQVETPQRIRCGALVCEACKRFFMRHKRQLPNGEGIKCKHGNDQCLKEVQERKAKVTQRGWLWRGLCPACRFKRCVQVGMQYRGKPNHELTKPSNPSSFTTQWQSDEPSPDYNGYEVSNDELEKSVANDYKWLIEFCEVMKRKKEMEHFQYQQNQQYILLLNTLTKYFID